MQRPLPKASGKPASPGFVLPAATQKAKAPQAAPALMAKAKAKAPPVKRKLTEAEMLAKMRAKRAKK